MGSCHGFGRNRSVHDASIAGAGRMFSTVPFVQWAAAKPCGRADHFSADVLEIKIKTHKLLPAELKQAAEDAATHWAKGTVENLLPAPALNAAASEVSSPKVATTTPPLSSAMNKKSLSVVEVPLKEDSGIFVVPVEINGAITLD